MRKTDPVPLGMRYQVLRDGSSIVENYRTKYQAQRRVEVLYKQGILARVWDTAQNPLSDALNGIFR